LLGGGIKITLKTLYLNTPIVMNIQATKIDLIHWLTELKDTNTLKQLKAIKEGQDWWEMISEEDRGSIDEGLAQLDRGEGIPHEQVMKEAREKFNL